MRMYHPLPSATLTGRGALRRASSLPGRAPASRTSPGRSRSWASSIPWRDARQGIGDAGNGDIRQVTEQPPEWLQRAWPLRLDHPGGSWPVRHRDRIGEQCRRAHGSTFPSTWMGNRLDRPASPWGSTSHSSISRRLDVCAWSPSRQEPAQQLQHRGDSREGTLCQLPNLMASDRNTWLIGDEFWENPARSRFVAPQAAGRCGGSELRR